MDFIQIFFYTPRHRSNSVHSNDDRGRVYQNCLIYDSGAGVVLLGRGQINHTVKMFYFSSLLLAIYIRHIEYIVRITMKRFTQVVNFMTTGGQLFLY